MRRVGLTDLDLAARVLLAHPQVAWDGVTAQMLDAAHVADKWRKRTGRRHPDGGTGSLFVQASLMPHHRDWACDQLYFKAIAAVIAGLETWRARGGSPYGHVAGRKTAGV